MTVGLAECVVGSEITSFSSIIFYWWRLLTKIRDELKLILEVILVWSSSGTQ